MGFEKFVPKMAKSNGHKFITFQGRGVVTISSALYSALDDPDAVDLYYDDSRDMVAIKPAKDGRKVCGCRAISATGFAEACFVEITPLRVYLTYDAESEMFCGPIRR